MDLVPFQNRNKNLKIDAPIVVRLSVEHVRSLSEFLPQEPQYLRLRSRLSSAEQGPKDRDENVSLQLDREDLLPVMRIAMQEYQNMAASYTVGKRDYHKQQFAEAVAKSLGVKMTLGNVGVDIAPETNGYQIDVSVDTTWKPLLLK